LFDADTVTRAALKIGLSSDPFPDLGKLVAACRYIEAESNPQVIRGDVDYSTPHRSLIEAAAKALGMKI
jgi:hypothetical protein